jgi:type I restriction enzyme, S subunit
LEQLPQNYSLSANIVLIQPRKINPTYLYYFFQSNQIEKAFKAGTNSTTQAAFGIQKVRELVIDLPNEDEQNLIVSELESKLTVCDKIEETISQSLQQAETLKQSILKKAFEGKLVNTEKLTVVNELR